nr:hypothetical protein [Tanacetum cinerariifolium]
LGTPTEPHHPPTPEATPSPQYELSSSSLLPVTTKQLPTVIPSANPPLRQYTKRNRIAQSLVLPTITDEPATSIGDDNQGEACPTVSSLEAEQDRANITKTSTLPSESTPRVTSLAVDEGSMQHKLTELTDLCTRLHRQQAKMASKINAQELEISQLKAKGKSLDEGEVAAVERSTERGSDDIEEMVTVLTSLDAASILTSGVSVSISPVTEVSVAKVPTGGVPTGIGMVPTTSPIFTTATEDAKIARIHAEEELHMMIDALDRNNETVAKKQQRDFYMSVLRSHAGWKTRHFKGMTLEEIKEKFDPVWKQMQDFIPMGSKEEGKRFKRKGLRLEQDSAKKLKTLEEVPKEKLKEMMQLIPVEEVYVEALQVKHPIIDWEIHTKREKSYWKITRLGGSIASDQFFVDMLKHFDKEDLNQP